MIKKLSIPLRIAPLLVAGSLALPAHAQDGEYRSLFGPPTAAKHTPSHANAKIPATTKIDQSEATVLAKSRGCIECHANSHDPHDSEFVRLGCTDCHGGDATAGLTMRQAHVAPKNPVFFESSANPSDSNVLLNHESPEFIQFVNPGDLRVAKKACGYCHAQEVDNVGHSMMRHGAMLWGAAAYNNGAYPLKDSIFGQAYGANACAMAGFMTKSATPWVFEPRSIRVRAVTGRRTWLHSCALDHRFANRLTASPMIRFASAVNG